LQVLEFPGASRKVNALMRKLLVVALSMAMVAMGLLLGKYKPFPYYQVVALYRTILINLGGQNSVEAELSKQYSRDTDRIPLDRLIDSGLLPLKITGARLSESHAVAKIGGAITAIGDTVIILDRLGNLYTHTPAGDNRKLAFPPLPNNIGNYVRAGMPLNPHMLRAHNVQYMADRNLLVVSHETFSQDLTVRMAVSVIPIDGRLNPVGEWRTVFLSGADEPHRGGALVVDDKGSILVTVGDYVRTGGRIVRVDAATQKQTTLSVGHRHAQGLLLTRSGQILSTEHGPQGGDELNLIVQGGDYGWPNVSLGTDEGTYARGEQRVGRHEGYIAPLFAWVPSIAVSNLIQVTRFNERWDGDLLVASLKAQSLFRVRLEGSRVLYSELIFIGQRVRSLAQLGNGTIVLWTDDAQLLFMSVDREKLDANRRYPEALNQALREACMFCHHFGSTNPADVAPTLSGLFARKIASDNYRYTVALRGREGFWTEKALQAFLLNPAQFASGTSMPPPNLVAEEVEGIVRALKEISDAGK
jgi:cytochrome c2